MLGVKTAPTFYDAIDQNAQTWVVFWSFKELVNLSSQSLNVVRVLLICFLIRVLIFTIHDGATGKVILKEKIYICNSNLSVMKV